MLFLTENIAPETPISGEGINLLKSIAQNMLGRGAPDKFNNYGFNKVHFDTVSDYISTYFHQEGLPFKIVQYLLSALNTYKNTQIPNYSQIADAVKKDVENFYSKSGNALNLTDKIKIFANEPRKYGKIRIYIPNGIDRSKTIKINKIIDNYCQTIGLEKERDNFGNFNYPRWKYFTKDKNNLNSFLVHEDIIEPIINYLKTTGLETEDPVPTASTPKKVEPPKATVITVENTPWGKKVIFSVNNSNYNMKTELERANFWKNGIIYNGKTEKDEPKYSMMISKTREILPILEKYMDTEELKQFAGEEQPKEPEKDIKTSEKAHLTFKPWYQDKIKLYIPYMKIGPDEKTLLKQITTYTFPEAEFTGSPEFAWVLVGDYNQYALFGKLLKQYNYNLDELRTVLKAKIEKGEIKKQPVEGYIPDPNFFENISKELPNSEFKLYEPQKDGIAFLYSRKSAILGDATGVGKTLQTVGAAEIKMKDLGPNSSTLVITLKSTQEQFKDNILQVIGADKTNLISLNPMEPKKWTVLYYEMFSHGKNIPTYMQSLKNHQFDIAILDELHKLKHETSARTRNIKEILETVPIKWGASATVSSNVPMDVRNQLEIIGHPLGRMSVGKFKREMAGMVPEGWEGAYVPGSMEQQIEAAENLNKWLHLTGLYIRREKSDLKEMPNIKIEQEKADFSNSQMDDYQRKASSFIRELKDPELAISVLGAHRRALAIAKVPKTVDATMNLVKEHKKVLVFTNFIESGKEIIDQLRHKVPLVNPKYQVLTYTSDTPIKDRKQVKKLFTDDPNAIVLVMSMKMGGTGIDFPNATQNMIINDYDWTPEQCEQSEGRIYRINTTRPVNIQYIIANGTIDEDIFAKVEKKRELAKIIQRYRKDFQEENNPKEALSKIISAQKQMQELDKEMNKVPADIAGQMKEHFSFKFYASF